MRVCCGRHKAPLAYLKLMVECLDHSKHVQGKLRYRGNIFTTIQRIIFTSKYNIAQ